MPILTKSQLEALNQASFPDQSTEAITPQILREYNTATIDTLVDSLDTGSFIQDLTSLNSFTQSQLDKDSTLGSYTGSVDTQLGNLTQSQSIDNQKWNTLGNQSGSWVSSSITGSSLITASFDNGTRNLTFTKGDTTQFSLNIPDASGSILPAGVVSGSSQIDYPQISNIPSGIVSQSVQVSAITGSSVITASFDNGNRNLTFTKGDLTQFSVNIPDVSGSIDTGSFATTGSNIFNGDQTITGSLNVSSSVPITFNIPNPGYLQNGITFNGNVGVGGDFKCDSAFRTTALYTQTLGSYNSNQLQISAEYVKFETGLPDGRLSNIIVSGSVNMSGSLTTNGTNTFSGNTILNGTSSLYNTVRLNGGGLGDTNHVELDVIDSAFVLSAPSFVVGPQTLNSQYSSSAIGNQINLILKGQNATTDYIVSGSNNIGPWPSAPTAGFKRYVTSHNLMLGNTSTPQISGSMGWSPSINGNVIAHTQANPITWRGPVSSSVSTLNHNIMMGGQINVGTSATLNAEKAISGVNINNNGLFGGTIGIVANTTNLVNAVGVNSNLSFGGSITLNNISSSISYNSNINNGTLTVNNRFSPAVGTNVAALSARTNINTIYGTGHVINIDGTNVSTTQGKSASFNIFAGTFLSASVPDGDNSAMNATGIIGNGLVVTGSSLPATFAGPEVANSSQGSFFGGRFNALDGSKAKSGETVVAIGTGTSYTNRKTGFLIDSGSNTFVEGSFNVSGSSVFTGNTSVAPNFQAKFATGSNQQVGTATLDGGNPSTAVISNSLVSANSIILLTKQTLTNTHSVAISAKSAGSFTITSTGNGDTDVVGYMIINNS